MSEPLYPALDSPETGPTRDVFEGPPRSVDRIDRVLALLRQEWFQHSDQRFWQLLSNLADRMGIASYAVILEDEAFIEMLERRLDSNAANTDRPPG